MTVKKNSTFLEKSVNEIEQFKFKRPIWKNISFQDLAKDSSYSYKQFMKIVSLAPEVL